jgi:hypothetical protein
MKGKENILLGGGLIKLMMEFQKRILKMFDTIQTLSGLSPYTCTKTLKIKIYRKIILLFISMGVKHSLIMREGHKLQ